MNAQTLTLLSPRSVAGWYAALGGDAASMVVIGEDTEISLDALVARARSDHRTSVRIHSGHDSLERDRDIGLELMHRGYNTHVQSAKAVEAGRDKVTARIAMAKAGIRVTPWGVSISPARSALVKDRDTTQSRSIAWAPGGKSLEENSYWEDWVDGIEYSAVGYREAGETTMLPVVEKGRTRRDLLPPWQRMRTVGIHNPRETAEMLRTAREIANVFDIWGFFEVEFVVSDVVEVIELNPRISGTLRLAAMAAQLAVFADGALDPPGRDLPATLIGAELPFAGPLVAESRLIATSRITCVGDTVDEVRDHLQKHFPDEQVHIVEAAGA